jgi:hypothetical protein
MIHRPFVSFGVLAVVMGLVSAPLMSCTRATSTTSAGESSAVPWSPPKTPWGDPDLQGKWTNDPTTTPMERPASVGGRLFLEEAELAEKAKRELTLAEGATEEELAGPVRPRDVDRNYGYDKGIVGLEYNRFWTDNGKQKARVVWPRTSLVIDPPDGHVPPFTRENLQRWEARLEARRKRGQADSWLDRNLGERCISGANSRVGAAKQILQTPGYVVMLLNTLNANDVAIIPIDGRPPLSSNIRQWRGDSRGHWEGNTLVIETTNILPQQDGGEILPNHGGISGAHTHFYPGSGETLRIVERYTRVAADRMEYQYTIDDPTTYVQPYTVLRPMTKEDETYLMLEPACHEGNYGMPNSLSGARADERSNIQASIDETNARLPAVKAEWVELKRWEASRDGTAAR